MRSGLDVTRASDGLISLKLEIEGMMLNVVSTYTQKLDARWHRERNSGGKLDEVVENVPNGKRV